MNKVCLIGRLTKQPELRITQNGTSVTTFTLAVDRRGNDQKQADFLDCVAFSGTAEVVCKYGDKGRLVAVEGRLQTRSYETRDGQKRKVVEVVTESVQFLDSKKPETEEEETFRE